MADSKRFVYAPDGLGVYWYTLRITKGLNPMDRNASRRLIMKVVTALVVLVVALISLMATRAGLIDLSPKNIFMGMFLLIVGGALLNMVQAFIASDSASHQDKPVATGPEGGN